jgi:hypothetical protein
MKTKFGFLAVCDRTTEADPTAPTNPLRVNMLRAYQREPEIIKKHLTTTTSCGYSNQAGGTHEMIPNCRGSKNLTGAASLKYGVPANQFASMCHTWI